MEKKYYTYSNDVGTRIYQRRLVKKEIKLSMKKRDNNKNEKDDDEFSKGARKSFYR